MSVLTKPYFHDEQAAIGKLESILWLDGPVCPHCGGVEKVYDLKGKSTRPGLKKCGHCRKQFTVKIGRCSSPAMSRSTNGFKPRS